MLLKNNNYLTLDDLKKCMIIYSWLTLYVGRKLDLFNYQDIIAHATELLISHQVKNPLIIELAGISNDTSVDNLLRTIVFDFHGENIEESPQWKQETRKLRYCILKKLKELNMDNKTLLEKIALVYADFGYSQDMNEFIYYMPVQDDSFNPMKYTQEECVARLLNIFEQFLQKEKLYLEQLPP